MNMLWILIIIFSLLLVFLIGILIWHPSFPQKDDHIPSLRSSEFSSACTYDHTELCEKLVRQYPDLHVFMETDAMEQGIFMHWNGAKRSDTSILFDVSEEGMAYALLSTVQKLQWQQSTAAFDFYVLIRHDAKSQSETRGFFSQYLLSHDISIDAVINEQGGLINNEDRIYALISEKRFASIDFGMACDEGIAAGIIERFRAKMPFRPDGEMYFRMQEVKDAVPFLTRLGLKLPWFRNKAAAKTAELLPFMEIWARPCAVLIENEQPVIRLYARSDSELEEGISVMSKLLQDAGLDYGITGQKRYALTMENSCTVTDRIAKAASAVYPGCTAVHYSSCEMEGWPGIDTAGFSPVFPDENDPDGAKEFYTALLKDEEKHMA